MFVRKKRKRSSTTLVTSSLSEVIGLPQRGSPEDEADKEAECVSEAVPCTGKDTAPSVGPGKENHREGKEEGLGQSRGLSICGKDEGLETVMMKSATGERRLRKLKVLGVGGSSKVRPL